MLENSNLWAPPQVVWPINSQNELLVNDVVLKPDTSVKVLGITIDSRHINFSQHVRTKAARQVNSIVRISRYILKNDLQLICQK